MENWVTDPWKTSALAEDGFITNASVDTDVVDELGVNDLVSYSNLTPDLSLVLTGCSLSLDLRT